MDFWFEQNEKDGDLFLLGRKAPFYQKWHEMDRNFCYQKASVIGLLRPCTPSPPVMKIHVNLVYLLRGPPDV